MKSILFINGCLRGVHSRSLQLAKTYLETQKNHASITERNLCNWDVTFISDRHFDKETGMQLPLDDHSLATEFANADEIVLAAPYWEFLFPAMVSCYFEMVSIAGITFQYTATGSEGLCNAKAFHYFYSAGDWLKEDDRINEAYLKRLSKLYGIPTFHATSAVGLDIDPRKTPEIMAQVCKEIQSKF